MRRVYFAHGLTGVFLIVFGFFAFAVLAIGLLLAVGAERIAASPDGGGSAAGYYVAGAIVTIVGLMMVRRTFRDAGAVAVIDVGEDGTWTARTRFGRVVGTIAPDQERRFELSGRELLILSAAVPRRQELVVGHLRVRSPEASFRMATSGPYTYDQALGELGYDEAAPRAGEERIIY
jgi:hypothetical protein